MMTLRSVARAAALAVTFAGVLGNFPPLAAQSNGSNGSLLDRATTLNLTGERLEEALRLLQRSTGVPLAYSPDLIPGDRLVSCECAGLSFGEALTRFILPPLHTSAFPRRRDWSGGTRAANRTPPGLLPVR